MHQSNPSPNITSKFHSLHKTNVDNRFCRLCEVRNSTKHNPTFVQTLVSICTKVHLTRGTQSHHVSGPVKSDPVISLAASSCIPICCGRVLRQSVLHCSKGLLNRAEDGSRGHESTGSLVSFYGPDYLGSMFTLGGPR